jgi:O-acetyl-ADP-ribose deacetylase (regulator of RNase III)
VAAEEVHARTITLPAISCGIYGYPLDLGADIALRAVRDHLLEDAVSIEKATFVLFSDETLEAFRAGLARLSGR